MRNTAPLQLNLCEIDILLNLFSPRASQELGRFADEARAKLRQARKVLIDEFESPSRPAAEPSLFDLEGASNG